MSSIGQRRNRVGRDLRWIAVNFDGDPSSQIASEAFDRIQWVADCLSTDAYGEDGDYFADDVITVFSNLTYYIRSFRTDIEYREKYRQKVHEHAEKAHETLQHRSKDVCESWLSSSNAE